MGNMGDTIKFAEKILLFWPRLYKLEVCVTSPITIYINNGSKTQNVFYTVYIYICVYYSPNLLILGLLEQNC